MNEDMEVSWEEVLIERTAPLSYAQMDQFCVASKSLASDATGKEIRA